MPPEFLKAIPDSKQWSVEKAMEWASRLKVNVVALAYALKDENLIDTPLLDELKTVRIRFDSKVDPELPTVLSDKVMEQKRHLLELGLSDYYVGLCFDAYSIGVVSRGRLAECMLLDDSELLMIAELYGRSLAYGD